MNTLPFARGQRVRVALDFTPPDGLAPGESLTFIGVRPRAHWATVRTLDGRERDLPVVILEADPDARVVVSLTPEQAAFLEHDGVDLTETCQVCARHTPTEPHARDCLAAHGLRVALRGSAL